MKTQWTTGGSWWKVGENQLEDGWKLCWKQVKTNCKLSGHWWRMAEPNRKKGGCRTEINKSSVRIWWNLMKGRWKSIGRKMEAMLAIGGNQLQTKRTLMENGGNQSQERRTPDRNQWKLGAQMVKLLKAVKINRKRDGNNARGKMDGPERRFL